MPYSFSKIEDALEAIAAGRVVIVVDDEQRENEGDFVAAAERVTPETVEFMITHGRGQLCMPIMPELAHRLELQPMVEPNTAPHRTPFTVPVDHASCRTGISAEERARTVRAIIDPATRPERPASARGTSSRWSPRKGASSAARGTPRRPSTSPGSPGLKPAGVLCEILDGIRRRQPRAPARHRRASSACRSSRSRC